MIVHADLHVHSRYSGISPDWYLRLVQSPESYSEVENVFFRALKSGQTFVTITDHDQIEGAIRLKQIYPTRVFTGVEFNVYFPEDRCKVHILVYGLTENEYKDLILLRGDIYQFRDYLKQKNLAYSVAHALMTLDRKLSRTHLEKLILLFDVFEGINGSQLKIQNQTWIDTLHSLTPDRIESLYHRYHIEPISNDPWNKGITGGSDDHADLYIGRTYTEAKATSIESFLDAIRLKRTTAAGAHSTFRDLSMSVIKLAFETGRRKPGSQLNLPLFRQTAQHVFEGKPASSKTLLELKLLKWFNRFRPDPIRELMARLVEKLLGEDFSDANQRVNLTYDCLSQISDEAILSAIKSFNFNNFNGTIELNHSFKQIKSSLAGIFLSLPFYTTLGFMNASRHLVKDFKVDSILSFRPQHKKRILWFSDDSSISNFVAGLYDTDIIYISDRPIPGMLLEKQLLLPILHKIPTGEGEDQYIPIPSLLRSLDQLAELQPDEIIISTSGPVGIIGLLLSRLLKVPSLGIPQENLLSWQIQAVKDPQIAELMERYTTWFFNLIDQVVGTTSEPSMLLQAVPVNQPLVES